MHASMRGRRAFTLVELLVVVAIIALLLGILVPSLGKARKVTEQTLCGANLNQWGKALVMYRTEHGKVPAAHGDKQNLGGGRYGSYTTVGVSWMQRIVRPGDRMREGMITIRSMLPYLPGVDEEELPKLNNTTLPVSGPYICPGATQQRASAVPGWFPKNVHNWAHMHYIYVAGVDWDDLESRNRGLARNSTEKLMFEDMASDRLMMADDTFYLPSWQTFSPAYTYNHARAGVSHPFYNSTGTNNFTESLANMAGVNHLYGDGHVTWINEGSDGLDAKAIMANDPDVRFIKSTTSGSTFRWYY